MKLKPPKIDILIPLIKGGSKLQDMELRYCLRSISKHLKGYDRVIIVGHLPEFINPDTIIHLPYKDRSPMIHKQANIRSKILQAFHLSGSLFFMNDDHFMLQDFDVKDFPYYWSGDLKGVAEKGSKPLLVQLQAQGKPQKWYDGHFPILYHKEGFKEAVNAFSEEVIIKSSYCNYHQVEGEYLKDLKINSGLRVERIREEIKGRPCFSVGDYGMSNPMKQLLQELYPKECVYETGSSNSIKHCCGAPLRA